MIHSAFSQFSYSIVVVDICYGDYKSLLHKSYERSQFFGYNTHHLVEGANWKFQRDASIFVLLYERRDLSKSFTVVTQPKPHFVYLFKTARASSQL